MEFLWGKFLERLRDITGWTFETVGPYWQGSNRSCHGSTQQDFKPPRFGKICGTPSWYQWWIPIATVKRGGGGWFCSWSIYTTAKIRQHTAALIIFSDFFHLVKIHLLSIFLATPKSAVLCHFRFGWFSKTPANFSGSKIDPSSTGCSFALGLSYLWVASGAEGSINRKLHVATTTTGVFSGVCWDHTAKRFYLWPLLGPGMLLDLPHLTAWITWIHL